MGQNDPLSSHITLTSILLCPALYCVQHITVSSTLLCLTKYCAHTYPKGLLFTFHILKCCSRIMLRWQSTPVFIEIKGFKVAEKIDFLAHLQ